MLSKLIYNLFISQRWSLYSIFLFQLVIDDDQSNPFILFILIYFNFICVSFPRWYDYMVSRLLISHSLSKIKLCYRRPLNNTPSGGNVDIQIRQRYSWRRGAAYCDDTTIANKGLIGDNSVVRCVTGTCSSWTTIRTRTHCTDYSSSLVVSSGEKYETKTITLGISFSISYLSAAWFGTLVVGSNSWWSITNRIDTVTRPDGYINSSPIATTLPVIYRAINQQHVHVVDVTDFDGTDVLKCRWSTSSNNFNSYNECQGVCSGVPNAVLYGDNCTLVFTLTRANYYAAVAIQI